jgi:hypothetical protein
VARRPVEWASSVRRKAPVLGSVSSSRWMVFPSSPVVSEGRLAARPVGAQGAIVTVFAPKDFEDRVDQCGFADTWAAGDHQQICQAKPFVWANSLKES